MGQRCTPTTILVLPCLPIPQEELCTYVRTQLQQFLHCNVFVLTLPTVLLCTYDAHFTLLNTTVAVNRKFCWLNLLFLFSFPRKLRK